MTDKDIELMGLALEEAKKALAFGDVPVGALIVDNNSGDIIATSYNRREADASATAHAEILAIEAACQVRGGWRLSGCTLYVTLEPCPMCTGAIVNSRIDRVVFGAYDMVAGCCGSVANFNNYPFNHTFCVEGGVMETECARILKDFFEIKRKKSE